MKLVVLAAGYATRLYPLTLDRPKPLLPVGGRPMLEHLLDRLEPIGFDATYVVTNAKFAPHFRAWASGHRVTVVDDGTTDEESRLGAIGDLGLVLEREAIDDDVVVVAGDNLFDRDLGGFGKLARSRAEPLLAVYDIGSLDEMRKFGAVEVDSEGRIVGFEEKPAEPRTTLAALALYHYPRATLPLVRRYLAEGRDPDQPGRLVAWLHGFTPVYTWRFEGRWYDIGSRETLETADAELSARS
jgi:glucose-1-phosphate thymidylyltransferase